MPTTVVEAMIKYGNAKGILIQILSIIIGAHISNPMIHPTKPKINGAMLYIIMPAVKV